MIKGGAEVKIIDNRTKEDLTSVTLAQIIFEEEKKRSQMPLGVLREIIRHGGEAVAGFYQEKVGQRLSERISEVKSRTESLREDIEQKVRTVLPSLLRREDKGEKRDGAPPEAEPPKDGEGKPAAPIKDLFVAGQRAIEELQGKVDQSVKQAIEGLAGASLNELQRLQRQVEALEKKIEQLTHRQ
jgi:hypothetical protein